MATIGSPGLPAVVARILAEPVDAELVLVVDAPTLDVAPMLGENAMHPRLRLLHNDANLGLTRSLNRGLTEARAELILRNDDDDLPAPDRIARTIAFFRENPDCDLAFAFATGRDEATGREWRIDGPLEDAAIKARLAERNFIVHSTLAFRKRRLAPLGFYDPTFRYAQDYDLYLRAIRAGLRFGAIAEPLVTRSYHPASITVARRKRQILYSFAARLIHDAETAGDVRPWRTLVSYAMLLGVPNALRDLRRRLGFGR
jgi:GT2 family glycosyltransferase